MSERMTEAEFNSLLIRRVNRDGTAERLCSVAHAEITTLRAEVERFTAYAKRAAMDVLLCKDGNILLHEENEKLRKELDEAQREITQLYEDAAGESI